MEEKKRTIWRDSVHFRDKSRGSLARTRGLALMHRRYF